MVKSIFMVCGFMVACYTTTLLVRGEKELAKIVEAMKNEVNTDKFCVTGIATELHLKTNELEASIPLIWLDFSAQLQTLTSAMETCPHFFIVVSSDDQFEAWLNELRLANLEFAHSYFALWFPNKSLSEVGKWLLENDSFVLNIIAISAKWQVVNYQDSLTLVGDGQDNFTIYGQLYPKNRLDDLHGKVLQGATFRYPPYTYINENGQYDGNEAKQIEAMSRVMNFQIDINPPTDGGLWGADLGNGTYSGLVGDIQMKRIDLGWAGIFLFPQRAQITGFTFPSLYETVCFMVSKPKPLPHWLSLIIPMDGLTWLAFFITSLTLLVAFMAYPHLVDSSDIHSSSIGIMIVFDLILNASIYVQKIKSRALNVFLQIVIPALFILTTAYKGALTSVLTIDLPRAPMDSAQELVENNVQVGSNFDHACNELRGSSNHWHQTLGATCYAFLQYDVGFARAQTDAKFAVNEGKSFLEYTIRERFTNKFGLTDKHITKECNQFWHVSFLVPKGSVYKSKFSILIMRMSAAGLQRKFYTEEMDKKAILYKELLASSQTIPLNLHHMQGAFFLYTLVIWLAIIAFLLEITLIRIVRKKIPAKEKSTKKY